MTSSIYIKIPGITGVSANPAHKDEVELLNIAFTTSNSVGYAYPMDRPPKATITDLMISKRADATSIRLFELSHTMEVLEKVVVTIQAAAAEGGGLTVLTLENAIVTSFSFNRQSAAESSFENFSLSFAKITMEQKPGKAKKGAQSCIQSTFDVIESAKETNQ